jgi:hypothetical protein
MKAVGHQLVEYKSITSSAFTLVFSASRDSSKAKISSIKYLSFAMDLPAAVGIALIKRLRLLF